MSALLLAYMLASIAAYYAFFATLHMVPFSNLASALRSFAAQLVADDTGSMGIGGRVITKAGYGFVEHFEGTASNVLSIISRYSVAGTTKFDAPTAMAAPAQLGEGVVKTLGLRSARHARPGIVQAPTGGYNCAVM